MADIERKRNDQNIDDFQIGIRFNNSQCPSSLEILGNNHFCSFAHKCITWVSKNGRLLGERYTPFKTMRNPDRIQPTLDKLAEFWREHPDFRLGQLIMAITMTGEHNPKLFNLEDEEFLRLLDDRKKQLAK